MKIYRSTHALRRDHKKGSAIVIGNFDGVHFGHRQLIATVTKAAKRHGVLSLILSFEPHPVKVLAPQVAPLLLNTLKQKAELLAATGADALFEKKFDMEFAKTSPEDFVGKFLFKELRAKIVVVGYDFTFGVKRSGTIETLEQLGKKFGIEVIIVPAQQTTNNILVSSTLIRSFVSSGQVRAATELLTRPYFIDGQVVQGHQRGRQMGIQTANLKTQNELLPKDGVYATFARVGTKHIKALTNIGFNPTFGDQDRSIETHLLNFNAKLYGKRMRLYFIERLRDEIKFNSPQELVTQIGRDIEQGKVILENCNALDAIEQ